MLELKQITKIYQTNASATVTALSGVSVCFRKSEFVSVLGPSGCGKTTMLNIIGGLDRYTSGDLVVDGKSTAQFSDRDWDTYRNRKIGFVFQSYNLIMHQTVLENVELALTLSGVDAITRKRKAMLALDKVGLADHLRKKPNELSGGEMQRVAIARAIVNDPEIILADEPTGALDSKTSVQIMDLLKEISKDRLVIMVTHNDALANSYSTRIIRLLDSKIIADSNPYSGEQESKKSTNKPVNAQNKQKSSKKSGDKNTKKHTSMSFWLSLSLSFKNLLTKKTRTTLTSLASSIGIIGLALVLALFNGLNVFLDKVQYDTLSAYPMSVSTSSQTDYEQVISIITDSSNYVSDENMKDKIFVSHLVTQLNSTSIKNTITPKYLDYVKKAPEEYVRDITYSYGTSMNIFKKKVVFDSSAINGTPQSIIVDNAKVPVNNYFKEIVGDKDFILSQYDLVAGEYPDAKDELVLVLDKNNRISDTMLVAFLMDINATQKDENGDYIVNSYEYDDFLCKRNENGTYTDSNYGTFMLALNDGLYTLNGSDLNSGYYQTNLQSCKDQLADKPYYGGAAGAERIEKECNKFGISLPEVYSGSESQLLDLRIVGILRLNENTTTGAMSAYPIGYTSELTEYVVEQAKNSKVVKAQLEQLKNITDDDESTLCRNVTAKIDAENAYYKSENEVLKKLKNLGYAETPTKIEFYATSFEGKQQLKRYLNAYNETVEDNEKVYVTDVVSTVIDVLNTFIDTITYILLALTAISLVVAAIMIAIITYVSVIERTREIGILRSIGARKIDVMSVFNAETIIIGLFSGILGVLFALILQFPLNALLFKYTGISSLASLSALHAILLIVVSMLVTLISGFIPSLMASKKDPVKALRSE